MNTVNPFDNVEPHIHLPPKVRAAFWAACELVLQTPANFAEAATWLNHQYSEQNLLAQCRADYWRVFSERFFYLRRDGTGNFARSSYARHIAIQNGMDRQQLMQEMIEESRIRGYRLNGTEYVCRTVKEDYPDEKVIDETNVDVVWRNDDMRYLDRIDHLWAEWNESGIDESDSPSEIGWRIERALGAVIEAGLPAGQEEKRHARRVVLLTFLFSYQHQVPPTLTGDFCQWGWEDIGNCFSVIGAELEGKPRPFYLPGRNTLLFDHPLNRDTRDFQRWVPFAELVARAVNILTAGNADTSVAHGNGSVTQVMATIEKPTKTYATTLEKVTAILAALRKNPNCKVPEAAQEIEVHKTTLFRWIKHIDECKRAWNSQIGSVTRTERRNAPHSKKARVDGDRFRNKIQSAGNTD